MDAKERLVRLRDELLKRAEAITIVLKYEFGEDSSLPTFIQPDHSNSTIFPIKAGTNKQISWLFENVFSKAIKLKEVSDKLAEYKGDKVKIDNLVRRMRTEGKLVLVKYDNKQILSWWGKPDWIDGNDFAPEYKADDAPHTDVTEVVTT